MPSAAGVPVMDPPAVLAQSLVPRHLRPLQQLVGSVPRDNGLKYFNP